MNVQIINPIEYANWDELLLTNDQSTFFHTSSWAKVLNESYGYNPLYFTIIKDNMLMALLPVMEIKNLLTGSRGVSLPFTDHCSPIAENQNAFNLVFEAVVNHGKKANWKAINLKGGMKYLKGTSSLASETFLTHYLDLSGTEKDIFSTFRDSTKRNIKKSVKNGVHAKIQQSIESVKEYYKLNCITRKSHGIPPQPYYFFKKIYEHIISQKKGFVAQADYQNKIVAGAVFFQFGNKAIYKYGASCPRYFYLRPNNLLMWEAIKWYSQNGIKKFDFGRTEIHHNGLRQFKRGWGTTEEILNYYKYDTAQNTFVTPKAGIRSSYTSFKIMPISILRLIGNLFYRYVG